MTEPVPQSEVNRLNIARKISINDAEQVRSQLKRLARQSDDLLFGGQDLLEEAVELLEQWLDQNDDLEVGGGVSATLSE